MTLLTYSVSTTLITEECYSCHCIFAMPTDLHDRARSAARSCKRLSSSRAQGRVWRSTATRSGDGSQQTKGGHRVRIYVASSWRNIYQPAAVVALRSLGHEVYDFKDSEGFSWRECDPEAPEFDGPDSWGYDEWQAALRHPAAERGFARDMAALATAHRCLMVLPCGRSAHLEAGWAIGQGKPTAIWCPEYDTPDLMVKMADVVCPTLDGIFDWLGAA